MVKVESRVEINRRPADVFAFLIEPANWSSWLDGIIECRQLGAGGMTAGTRVSQVIRFLGRRFDTTAEVVDCQRDLRLTMKVISGPFPMSWTHLVDAADEGSAVTTTLDADPGRFFRVAGPLLKPLLQRHFDDDHATLKALLERASSTQRTARSETTTPLAARAPSKHNEYPVDSNSWA